MPARPRSLLLCVMCSLAPLAARALSFGSPPTAALTVPSPAAASSTVQIRCDATASSGNLVTRVTFTVSGGTLDNGLAQMDANVTPANAVTGFASWSTPAPGTYTVDCTARDNQLLNGIAPQRTVSVVAMAPPVIDSLVADATDVYPGTVVHLTASAHDPNGQAIAYTWSSTAGTLAPAGASADWTAPPVPGNAAVTLRAESAGGAVQQSVAIQTVLARSALAFSAPAGTPFVPQRIAVAADDRAFVTDAAAGRVTIFSRLGALAGSFAVAGRPAGIAVNDAGDRIFVSDLSRAAVDVYDPLGARLGTVGLGELSRPVAMALDRANGLLYVSDADAQVVRIYDGAGAPFGTLDFSGGSPAGLAFDAGRVYVANLGASELGVFARPPATSARPYAGARIATITGGNLSRASSVAVGSDGNLYVVDSFQGRIAAFAPAGAFLGNVGSYGDGLGQLELPVDAAATPGGHLLVTSTRTGRVESYALQGAAPLTCPGDSDCDGMPDWWEIAHGLDPFNPADAFLDPDGDGLTNLDEYRLGTDPHKWDTDGDGISDGAEVRAGTNPLDPSDNRPAASAGTSLATDPTLVQLDGGGSHDPNGDLLTHEWRQVSGPATLALEGADKARVRFVARQAGDYVLALRVRDPNVWSPDATVTVTVRDVAPTADAGPDVAARVGDAVALDGRFSSDANGSVLSFAWTQASGPAAVLSDPAAPVASFVPAQAGVYAFDLVVNDGVQSSAPARVVVVADAPGDHVPVALAARPPEGFAGAPVVLDGTRSLDLDGDPLAYAWTQLSGPVVALDGAARAVASFTPPQPGLYRFALAVSDARHESPPDVVTVVVGGPSSPARASVATPMRGAVLQPVTVSGLLSYGDAATLAFAWSQRAGPHVPFDVSAPVLAFTPIEPGTYEFELQVSDASGAGTITRFAIPVDGPGNTVPVAAASASASVTGEPAQLDAGASFDPDGAVLGYAWAQTGGPRVPLSSPRAPAPTFVPSVPGTYEFELRVDDGALRSPAARVALAVGTPLDYPPIAVAADLVARAGDGAVLDGSGSVDPESRPITYLWTQVSGPAGVTLSGADTPLPAVAGLVSGYSYRFDLVVNDGANASLPAAVHVSAVDVPLANAHVMGPARVSVAHAGSVLDGAAVDVPAGALPGWSWIAVGEVTRAWYAAEGRSPVGPALFVGPVGVPLSSPLTITVPLPAGFSRPAKAQTLRVSGFDYAGNAWVDVPAAVDTDSRTVRFEGGFGTYQLTAPGDAGGGGSAGRSGCGTAGTGTPLDLVAAIGALLLWAGFRRRRASAPCGEVVRMDTRHAKARAILAAVALASAGSVAAVDTPHWGATNASGCQGCHQIHNAPGLALTNQAGNENVCFQCHASSGWASTQQASPGAGTGSSHRWDAVVATSPYATTPTNAGCPPSDTGCVTKRIDAAGKLMCSTCHDQHGGGNEPFTPFATSYTSGTGTGRKFMRMPNNAGQLCGACHYDRQTAAATDLRTWDGGTKSHPVGAGKTLGTRDPTLYNTVPLDVNGAVQVNAGSPDADGNVTNNVVLLNTNKASYTQGEVVCLTCHAVHFADSSSATADTGPTAAGDGNLLRRSFRVGSPTAAAPADADDACTGCHKARQHSSATTSAKYGTWSKTCRDCHEGHGTSNLLLVKGTLNSKTISLRQLSAGDASTGGTAANDLADAAGNGPCEACHTQTKDARAAGAQPRFRTTGLGANGMHFTKNCTACHSHLNGFVGRESAGGENCYPCHSYGMRSADASRTSTYHHVIESDVAAAYTLTIGAPTSAVPTLATADGDKRCTQCHVDHPFGANRATNLRTGIGTGPSSAAADWNAAAPYGACLSCHASQLDKNQTDQKADGTTKTYALDGPAFGGSAHEYATEPAGQIYRPTASSFSVACVKCHSDAQPTATQDGTFRFALHASQDRRLLSPLGAPAADNLEEKFCYRCHSASTDVNPGGGPAKSITANDYYGAVTTMSAGATGIFAAMQKGTAGTPGGPTTTTNTLYFKPTAEENPVEPMPNAHAGADAFSAQTNAWIGRSMSPFASAVAFEAHDATARTVATGTTNWRRVTFTSPAVSGPTTVPAGNWTINIFDRESSANANAQVRYMIYAWNANDTQGATIAARANFASEMGTTAAPGAQQAITVAGSAATLAAGDKIVVDLEIQTVGVGTGGSYSMTYYFGSGAASNVVMPSTVTFSYANPGTSASGRHDVGTYGGLNRPSPADETRAYIAANKHVECADCHNPHGAQQRAANSFGSATGAGTTTTLVDATKTWTASQWIGAQVIVRSGARAYARGSVTANTANTLTFTPAMASATAAGDQYVLEFRNGSGTATAVAANGLTDTGRAWQAGQWVGYTVSIVGGTGAGQAQTITASTANSITVGASWSPALAVGSRYSITRAPAVMTGASGVDVTAWGNAWLGPTTLNPSTTTGALPNASAMWQVCFKCHSSANGSLATWSSDFTDLALELNPNNASYHPVVASLPVTDPGPNGSSQLNPAQLINGWTPGQTMTCTDCHGADAASPASQGPHGSAIKYMLAGVNKAWPFTQASQNGGTAGTPFTTNTSETNIGTNNGLFCRNCHPPMNNIAPGGEMHATFNGQHSSDVIATCVRCHIRVPHGGKVSRLIVTTNAPARYRVTGQTPNLTSFTKQAYTGYTANNSFVTAPCGQHSGGTAEQW